MNSLPLTVPRAGAVTFDGTRYDGQAYTGPEKLTDARPWADEAACHDLPFIFEEADGLRDGTFPVRRAKAICESCPAIQQCFAEMMAEETGPASFRYSVRAGLTPTERAALWEAPEVSTRTDNSRLVRRVRGRDIFHGRHLA